MDPPPREKVDPELPINEPRLRFTSARSKDKDLKMENKRRFGEVRKGVGTTTKLHFRTIKGYEMEKRRKLDEARLGITRPDRRRVRV